MVLCHLLVPEWVRKSPRNIDRTQFRKIHECPLCAGPPRVNPCPIFKKKSIIYSTQHDSTGSTASLDTTGTSAWLAQLDDISTVGTDTEYGTSNESGTDNESEFDTEYESETGTDNQSEIVSRADNESLTSANTESEIIVYFP